MTDAPIPLMGKTKYKALQSLVFILNAPWKKGRGSAVLPLVQLIKGVKEMTNHQTIRNRASHYYGFHVLNSCYEKSIFKAILFLIILTLSGCSVGINSAVVSIPETRKYSIAPDTNVVLIQPKVTFELIGNEKKHAPEGFITKDISELLIGMSEEEIHGAGLHSVLLSGESIAGKKNFEAVKELEKSSNRLVSTILKETDLNILQNVCDGRSRRAVLIQYLRVKVGSEEEWSVAGLPPLSFQIVPRVKTSSSYLRAVIRDCQLGKVLWRNEVFIRETPNVESDIFKDAVRKIYSNLSVMEDFLRAQ